MNIILLALMVLRTRLLQAFCVFSPAHHLLHYLRRYLQANIHVVKEKEQPQAFHAAADENLA